MKIPFKSSKESDGCSCSDKWCAGRHPEHFVTNLATRDNPTGKPTADQLARVRQNHKESLARIARRREKNRS